MPNVFCLFFFSSEETMDGNTTRGSLAVWFVIFVMLKLSDKACSDKMNNTFYSKTAREHAQNFSHPPYVTSVQAACHTSAECCPLVDDHDSNQPDTLNFSFLRNIFKLYTRFTLTLLGRGLLMKDSSKYGTAMTTSTPR